MDGLEPTYSVLRSPLLPGVSDGDASTDGPPMLPCRLWGNSDRDGDVSLRVGAYWEPGSVGQLEEWRTGL